MALLLVLGSATPALGADLSIQPARVAVAKGARATARLIVDGGSESLEVQRIVANQGEVTAPRRVGKNRWAAVWRSNPVALPTVVIAYAEMKLAGKFARRWLHIPVHVKAGLQVNARPGESVEVAIEGKQFGPVTAKRWGGVSVPVLIPPGATEANVTSTNLSGRVRTETRKLKPGKFPRIVIAGPETAPAGGTVDIEAYIVTDKGRSYGFDQPLAARCAGCDLTARQGRRSLQAFTFTIPGKVGSITVEAFDPGGDEGLKGKLDLTVGAAQTLRLELDVAPSQLEIASSQSAKIEVKVEDRFGNKTTGDIALTVTANGKPVSMSAMGNSTFRGFLFAPKTRPPGDKVIIEAAAKGAPSVKETVKVRGGMARELTLRLSPAALIADGKEYASIEVEAKDRFGLPPLDRMVRTYSTTGKVLYLDWVKPGLFRGRFLPDAQPTGGVATLIAQTRLAPPVTAKVRLIPVPQRFAISPILGGFNNFGRMLGFRAALRFEYAAYRGFPSFYIGAEAGGGPLYSLSGEKTQGGMGFATGTARLRVFSYQRFMLDLTAELGILGVSVSTDQDRGGGVIDRVTNGRAAFVGSVGATFALRTRKLDEIFLDVRARYVSVSLSTGLAGNEGEIFFALGYRFML